MTRWSNVRELGSKLNIMTASIIKFAPMTKEWWLSWMRTVLSWICSVHWGILHYLIDITRKGMLFIKRDIKILKRPSSQQCRIQPSKCTAPLVQSVYYAFSQSCRGFQEGIQPWEKQLIPRVQLDGKLVCPHLDLLLYKRMSRDWFRQNEFLLWGDNRNWQKLSEGRSFIWNLPEGTESTKVIWECQRYVRFGCGFCMLQCDLAVSDVFIWMIFLIPGIYEP